MKAIGYILVSTTEQASEGYSLAAQEAKIRAYADLYGLDLVDVVARVVALRSEGVTLQAIADTLNAPSGRPWPESGSRAWTWPRPERMPRPCRTT